MKQMPWIALGIVLACIPLSIWMILDSFYPFETAKITAVIPTDKQVYYPGESVGFVLDICVDGYKWDEATFQLESDPEEKNYYFKTLGSFKSIGIPGCWKITDLNPVIPENIFEISNKVHEGRHRVYAIISVPQDEEEPPKIFQSDWFQLKKREE